MDLIARNADRFLAERKKTVDLLVRYLQTPYWRRDPERFRREWAALDKLRSSALSGFPLGSPDGYAKGDMRYLTMRSTLLQTELAAALELRRLDKGRYPGQLTALAPAYLPSLPIDPFGGALFAYRPSPDRKSYRLYGVGPTRHTRNDTLRYDATNGTMSEGDVIARR